MSQKIKGNTRGLKPSELKKLSKLYQRKLDAQELVSNELARELFGISAELRRRVGVLVSREGHVEEVCVGTNEILYLPELGRYRLGRARLRRLKLIFADISKHERATIPADIYADLEKLRLDMVVAVRVFSHKTSLAYAHLTPLAGSDGASSHSEYVADLNKFELDYSDFMAELEEQLVSSSSSSQALKKNAALLVGVYEKKNNKVDSSMNELLELANSAGVEVLDVIKQKRDLDPRTLLGKGKLEEVVLRCLRLGAEVLIFDAELKPGQWRAITNSTELKVLDRSMLILDIFAQRAKSSEGRLQVELAQLKYNLPRLVEMDTGLSRLSGGIGGRGPGETKLEIGRRRIRDRISDLERRIAQLGEQRSLRRERQRQNRTQLVSILGYTNVGKSTLFNALTKSTVVVENKLFATLDPAQRKLVLPLKAPADFSEQLSVVLSDTVGFIRDLPAELKNAFRATLEELHEADLLLEVLDASDPEIGARRLSVQSVLEELDLLQLPRLTVLNKSDLVPSAKLEQLCEEFDALPVSALNLHGLDQLTYTIGKKLLNKVAT